MVRGAWLPCQRYGDLRGGFHSPRPSLMWEELQLWGTEEPQAPLPLRKITRQLGCGCGIWAGPRARCR